MRGLVSAACVAVFLSLTAGSALASPRATQYDNPATTEPTKVTPTTPTTTPTTPTTTTPAATAKPAAKPATKAAKPAPKPKTTKVLGATTAVTKTSAAKAPAPAAATGALPFTGLNVALIVGLGGALLAGGLILRAAGRKRDDAA